MLTRTMKKHEIILEDVLKELVRIILRMGNQYMNAGLNEDVEISVDFDDSIIEDKEADFQRDSRMLQMGILNAYEFRMKWLNEDEATAKAAPPKSFLPRRVNITSSFRFSPWANSFRRKKPKKILNKGGNEVL